MHVETTETASLISVVGYPESRQYFWYYSKKVEEKITVKERTTMKKSTKLNAIKIAVIIALGLGQITGAIL